MITPTHPIANAVSGIAGYVNTHQTGLYKLYHESILSNRQDRLRATIVYPRLKTTFKTNDEMAHYEAIRNKNVLILEYESCPTTFRIVEIKRCEADDFIKLIAEDHPVHFERPVSTYAADVTGFTQAANKIMEIFEA